MASTYGDRSGQGIDPNNDSSQRDPNPPTDAPPINPIDDEEDGDLVDDMDDMDDDEESADASVDQNEPSGQGNQPL